MWQNRPIYAMMHTIVPTECLKNDLMMQENLSKCFWTEQGGGEKGVVEVICLVLS